MKKFKNLMANLPIYAGFVFQKLSEVCYTVSIQLHVALKTEIGTKIVQAKESFLKMAEQMKAMQAAQANESNKLTNLLQPETQPTLNDNEEIAGVIRLGKKNTDSKN